MTLQQLAAIEMLRNALGQCHVNELKGGVFDGRFCIWPQDTNPDPYESGIRFFEVIEKHGEVLHDVRMNLDGGAGV